MTGASRGSGMTLEERLERIESLLVALVERQLPREWYSVEEFARIVGRAEFTCREWCRQGRIRAGKRRSGRGPYPAWVISHDELLRYQREGLLPFRQPLRGDAEAKCG
jgi:Helix-turn-helix domain